jgi:tRNA(adenine34) deaminase
MTPRLAQARLGLAAGEVPIGAVLVVTTRSSPARSTSRSAAVDPTAHAEILVLREAARAIGNYRLLDATVYVTLNPA